MNPNPARAGANIFSVKLTDAAGNAVSGADVTLRLYMPAMPEMDMAAISNVVKLPQRSAGVYEGTGSIDSGGTWQVTITATQNGATLASKQLHLSVEGGM